MFEKVNPAHPDKIADRIAGALVDLAYFYEDNPKIAVEVLIGHGECKIIAETSVPLDMDDVEDAAARIAGGDLIVDYTECQQDAILAKNQRAETRCGDNGIFKGVPVTTEQKGLTKIVKHIYGLCSCDGKYIVSGDKLIACQSRCKKTELESHLRTLFDGEIAVNPLGDWTGGTDVDTGATNRKLGSDMADSVAGGGLHGKDLSKADVSVNIYAFLKAQEIGKPVELFCAIGDTEIDGKPYAEIVEIARQYIKDLGGFEKFAEWGLIR